MILLSQIPIPFPKSIILSSSLKRLDILTRRSASTMASQLSIHAFVNTKIESLSAVLVLDGKTRGDFKAARERKVIGDEEFNDTIGELEKEITQKHHAQ